MRVHLTFDVEVWCNGWQQLDAVFPGHYDRYVYGRSRHGEFALPQTLRILERHGLHGVFFVEPLFAARFGALYLETIVKMIQDGGHEVQLHVHPEWIDEIEPAVIPNNAVKRQHLLHYDVDEQTAIIAFGRAALEAAGAAPITAFRAGSYAANRASFEALRRNDILIDSSLNACFGISGADLGEAGTLTTPFTLGGVAAFPVTVFRDGSGRLRPAQVGACGFGEMRDALESAQRAGWGDFVIVSHNFELLKPGSADPDFIVVKRFERLCGYLAGRRSDMPVCGYAHDVPAPTAGPRELPRAGLPATAKRHVEQLRRRIA
jgi:hypothetical protein